MESGSLSGEIAQRKELLEKIQAEDQVVAKVREDTRVKRPSYKLGVSFMKLE